MEQELNIAAILRDKPYAKLWSPIIGVCELNHINSSSDINVTIKAGIYYNGSAIYSMTFNSRGKYGGEFKDNTIERECMLFPSKEMRDWRKFAWKKGDVLTDNVSTICIFDSWANDDYTEFNAKYTLHLIASNNAESEVCKINDFVPVVKDEDKQSYLATAETYFNVNLTKGSLWIEKPQFKDGDIVFVECVEEREADYIVICKNINNHKISDYCSLNINSSSLDYTGGNGLLLEFYKLRLATEEEKQQLFDALAKENKAWDADKKQIVDLPKKFKVLDYILIKNIFRTWQLHQYAFDNKYSIITVGGAAYSKQCKILPYNDQTAHLLGTTDDWEGGNND